MSPALVAEVGLSYAKHIQDSFYEGIDYYADNVMHYGRIKFDWELNSDHTLTFGTDLRDETMRSKTDALQFLPEYV